MTRPQLSAQPHACITPISPMLPIPPINTPLQWGAWLQIRNPNRFNGLHTFSASLSHSIEKTFTNRLTKGIN
jgi:hypothetical protein